MSHLRFQAWTRSCWTAAANLLLAGTAVAAPVVVDDFEDAAKWTVIASDSVKAATVTTNGEAGPALRLDFEFQAGSGFCVIRRAVDIALPPNYRFSFAIRGEAPNNNLEFKLVDPAGENVWWVNKRNFEFPHDWRSVVYQARHFRFAWGPSGGRPLEKVGFIEFAVAAGSGGKGTIWLDSLKFEELPPATPPSQPPQVTVSSTAKPDGTKVMPLDPAGIIEWGCAAADKTPWAEIDLQENRELGGLLLKWDGRKHPTDYELLLQSEEGAAWQPAAERHNRRGGLDVVLLPGSEARRIRVAVKSADGAEGVVLHRLQIQGPEFAESPNAMMQVLARAARRGLFPRYLLGEQTPWTIVGVPGDAKEALLDVDGALEVDKLELRIEPFLRVGDKLITWADGTNTAGLAQECLPIPTVTRRAEGLALAVTAFADGKAGSSELVALYRVINTGDERRSGDLWLAIRPFQVLPPWQELNVTGGVAPIEELAWAEASVTANGRKKVRLVTRPDAVGAVAFADGEIATHLAEGRLPASPAIKDSARLASGAARYSFDLAPGEMRTVAAVVPFHEEISASASPGDDAATPDALAGIEARLRAATESWSKEVNRVGLTLPPAAAKLANTFKTMQADILINADGPAIQPGSRTYERSWIRDGALTSTALLATGHADTAKAFLEWYAGYQYPSGKVPCVVDGRGPDPVPEHDSTGEFIYALLKYYRFTRDREFLERHLPQVVAGVGYLEELRRQRMTDEYKNGPPEKRACFGLVPESISHEGYSAKPMHSYWDDFFVLKGLTDATTIAQVLGRTDLEPGFAAARDSMGKCLDDSLRLAMQIKSIDYVPGCVELGDFDATSTTVAVFPCGLLGALPEPQLHTTFERYWDFFGKRRDGALDWENYTPYELRVVGTFVRLGQRQRAHELLKFFFHDQRPEAWNQWAEVVWREPSAPRFIGDMPHTWVGSDYVNAVRSMFVYERESDNALVIAAGVLPEWIAAAEGVQVERFPTEFGVLGYALRADGDRTILDLHGEFDPRPSGIVYQSGDPRPIRAVRVDDRPVDSFSDQEVTLPPASARVVIEHGEGRP